MICSKEKCTGCEACYCVCPKKAITMQEDDYGNIYPIIDNNKCIHCSMCKKVCPQLKKKLDFKTPMTAYAMYVKNTKKRAQSTSGGIASILYEKILEEDGIIYGASNIFGSTKNLHFIRIDNKEDLYKVKGSKYVHCHINGIYVNVKKDLLNNKKVLFIGTPCQVAGLRCFLMKEYDNLITADIICHGVPSQRLLFEQINELKIPVDEIKDKKLSINVLNDDESFNLPITFEKHARLSTSSNYLIKDNNIVVFKDNSFYLTSYSFIKMLKLEYKCLMKIYDDKGPYYTSALAFRLIYLILYPFLRNKKIWLFMDRRNAADDNGEQLFKYALSRKDNVKKYFTVSEDSKDYSRLAGKYKNVLPFYSIKQRLIYLFADKIISSHPDENILNPFYAKNGDLYSGLITSEKYFLQHGVTKDNISKWIRKYDKDLSLILTVSPLERKSFLGEDYNYSPEIIQTLGFPRFDNLENNNLKKQILIMPSWREYLQKSEFVLKNSRYFKGLNDLLNNEELIGYAKNRGYKIIFKPHPNLAKFIHLFDLDESIIADDKKSYQDLFNESELLITDYSSVAFDFSYLKKPVIYYQYSDDYNFDLSESYFDYKTMGFGEVIKKEDDLIKLIKGYLDNNCEMKEVYKKRVDNFYKYNDQNNSKRVYNWIYEN